MSDDRDAERLRTALLDGAAPDDMARVAATLLTEIPDALYADPALGGYLTFPGRGVAAVDWPKLGIDLLGGAFLHLPPDRRALLLIASSIGGGAAVPVRLGPVLSECRGRIRPLTGALQLLDEGR